MLVPACSFLPPARDFPQVLLQPPRDSPLFAIHNVALLFNALLRAPTARSVRNRGSLYEPL